MEKDEKTNPEEKQETTTSVEDVKPDTEVSKGPVPYDRFKGVIDSRNEMKGSIDDLKEEIKTLKQQQPEKIEKEPVDWKEAEDRAVNKALKKMEDKKAEKDKEARNQEQLIETSFVQLKDIGREITPDVKKAVLTRMIETGSVSVFDTYLAIEKEKAETDKTEQTKKDGVIPKSQKGDVAGKPGIPYKELRSKTIDQIIEEGTSK